jgi:phage terminase large subunit GpA-like protein
MKMSNIKQAEMRTSGQFEKQIIKYSTPTAPKRGIDLAYASSTQEHFMFKCPVCGKWSEIVFPDDIVIYADSLTDIKNLDERTIAAMNLAVLCSTKPNPLGSPPIHVNANGNPLLIPTARYVDFTSISSTPSLPHPKR